MNADGIELAPGSKIGRYVIKRLIGAGGMGSVYEAVHEHLEKRVAIKLLDAKYPPGSAVHSRFLAEGKTAVTLRHPNVVDVIDVGVEAGRAYLVMEYLEGRDLSAYIAQHVRLDEGQMADLLLPLLSAVHTAHRKGIIHRDLKPENVLLRWTRSGSVEPKLLDFGISHVDRVDRLTKTRELMGTPFYMAPEVIESQKADARSDQYGLGVIMYELASGRLPFEEQELFPLMRAIVSGAHLPLSRHRHDLHPDFVMAVERAMHVDPKQRFDSVADLGRALLPFASQDLEETWERTLTSVPPPPDPSTGELLAQLSEPHLAATMANSTLPFPVAGRRTPRLRSGGTPSGALLSDPSRSSGNLSAAPNVPASTAAPALAESFDTGAAAVLPSATPGHGSKSRRSLVVGASLLGAVVVLGVVVRLRSAADVPRPDAAAGQSTAGVTPLVPNASSTASHAPALAESSSASADTQAHQPIEQSAAPRPAAPVHAAGRPLKPIASTPSAAAWSSQRPRPPQPASAPATKGANDAPIVE